MMIIFLTVYCTIFLSLWKKYFPFPLTKFCLFYYYLSPQLVLCIVIRLCLKKIWKKNQTDAARSSSYSATRRYNNRNSTSSGRGNNFLSSGNDPDTAFIINPDNSFIWETYAPKDLRGLQPIIRVNYFFSYLFSPLTS